MCLRHFGRDAPAVGTHIRMACDPARLHLFDKITDRRIAEQASP